MRITGVPESQLAEVLREVDPPEALEITTCLRRGELEIATVFDPAAAADYLSLESAIVERFGGRVFSRDGSTIDDIVAGLLLGPPLRTVAVGESCTGGLMAARLTDRAGSSAYVLGGVTAYSNEAKVGIAGRAGGADRAARRGVAGGGAGAGGRCCCAVRRRRWGSASRGSPARTAARRTSRWGPSACAWRAPTASVLIERAVRLPGDRAAVRERTTTLAMHLLRRALLEGRQASPTRREPPTRAPSRPVSTRLVADARARPRPTRRRPSPTAPLRRARAPGGGPRRARRLPRRGGRSRGLAAGRGRGAPSHARLPRPPAGRRRDDRLRRAARGGRPGAAARARRRPAAPAAPRPRAVRVARATRTARSPSSRRA